MKKYEALIVQIREQIEHKTWGVGDKLPSLRKQAELSGLSLMTVLNAYQTLESQGWITSHARSGYFVAPQVQYTEPKVSGKEVQSTEAVDINDLILIYYKQVKYQILLVLVLFTLILSFILVRKSISL